jgi:hypothetical protein
VWVAYALTSSLVGLGGCGPEVQYLTVWPGSPEREREDSWGVERLVGGVTDDEHAALVYRYRSSNYGVVHRCPTGAEECWEPGLEELNAFEDALREYVARRAREPATRHGDELRSLSLCLAPRVVTGRRIGACDAMAVAVLVQPKPNWMLGDIHSDHAEQDFLFADGLIVRASMSAELEDHCRDVSR